MASADQLPFLPIIQVAITPVILLSGTGALMLSLTNRMGRVVDRTRAIAGQIPGAAAPERPHLEGQLAILWRRAKLVRGAVTCAALSMLVACFLVVVIFLGALLAWEVGSTLVALFVASLGLLIAALIAFLRDIYLSLHALRLEVDRARNR